MFVAAEWHLLNAPVWAREREIMANLKNRLPYNVLGRFYIDDSCVDCDMCRGTAPHVFKRNDEAGSSYAYRQPVTEEEIKLAEQAVTECPTESIGNDGEPAVVGIIS